MTDITPLIPKGKQAITRYGNGRFTIAEKEIASSVIVFTDKAVEWQIYNVAEISMENVWQFLQDSGKNNDIELIIFGTGSKYLQLPKEVISKLRQQNIAVEVMDTGAACRTFNILLAEERKVAAALIAV